MTDTSRPAAGLPRDLMPRLISGLVLAAVALVLTWAAPATFAILVLGVAVIVAWEWGRMVRKAGLDAIFWLQAAALVGAGLLTLAGRPVLAIAVIVLGAALSAAIAAPGSRLMSGLGALYAGSPVVALLWIRGDASYGLAAALLVLLCVWASDTGAYFAGRGIGGPKLMPAISPNKTWSGSLGGLAASLMVALVAKLIEPPLPLLPLLGMAVLFAIVSQAGDLLESALKRHRGVKDTSGLIPGHGGFMDRVDGLIFAAVAAALLAAAIDASAPARAMLTWN